MALLDNEIRLLDNEKEIDVCEKKFHILLEEIASMSYFFSILDDVIHDYARYIILNADNCDLEKNANSLYFLKMFRDLFVTNKRESTID